LNNCASIFNAFEIAAQLLQATDKGKKAIILVGDLTFTQSLRLVTNASVMGDASAAVLVSHSHTDNKLIATALLTAGKYTAGIWIEPALQRDFEAHFARLLKQVIDEVLMKAKLTLQDIALIIPHNVNRYIWRDFSKTFSIPFEKFFIENISRYAHCFGADMIINYVDVHHKGLLKKGDYYLMLTVGLGAVFCATLLQY